MPANRPAKRNPPNPPENATQAGDALYALRPDFQAACRKVDALGDYKDIHDLVHSLQFDCYCVTVKSAARFAADATALDDLQDCLLSFQDIPGKLGEVSKSAAVTASDTP